KEFVPSDIRGLIKQSIEFTMPRWKSMAHANGINYQIDKEDMKEVPYIMCNPTEIRDIFINVINNALDAMPEGGCISFSTWDRDEVVFVKITDTGEGMPEDVKKNVFDPFFTTKTPLGTGLGMSISYGTVSRHSGRIDVESEVGKGSTFTLQFPSTIKTASPIFTPKPEQETKEKNLRVLVVDDEEEICNMLVKFLSKSGNKVKAVDNGADAIKLINSEHFDLVLCDLAMPNVFGYDVIKVINKLEKKPKIGIVTGRGEELKPIEEEGITVDFILKKPFKYSVLSKYINDVCGKGSTDTEAS
ncbi:MAG: response regulator, partial [Deltaproteobacteria bacterium]|nr:response regulator [Deltaproteobacteria bacterium]